MKIKVLGFALGATLLFGVQQLATAAPTAAPAPASPAGIAVGQMSMAEPVYYVRRGGYVRGPGGGGYAYRGGGYGYRGGGYGYRGGGYVGGPGGHGCVGGRRCVGGYHGGVCRGWAACR